MTRHASRSCTITNRMHMMKNHTYLIYATFLTLILLMAASLFSSNKGLDLDPVTALKQVKEKPGVVIDVRTPSEYDAGHLADTDHLIDFLSDDFDEKISSLDKEQTYYVYCRSGNRSGKAMEKMLASGFRDVYNIGGYEELVESGFLSNK